MKTLYLLRHAKSSKDDPSLKDFDRPLNEKGKAQIQTLAKMILKEKIQAEVMISSPAKRAKDTAESIAKLTGYQKEIIYNGKFYEANTEEYAQMIKKTPDEYSSLMLIAHNPTLENFLSELISKETHLSTCSLARVQIPIVQWKNFNLSIQGELTALYTP